MASFSEVEWLYVLGGLGLIACGSWGVLRALRLRSQGVSTNGFVVRIKVDQGSRVPVVEFRAEGKTRRFTSRSQLGIFYRLKLGASVPIRYDPANPNKAVIDNAYGALAGPVGLVLLGLAVMTVAFVFALA